jgi:hypothetical protein
MNKILIAASTMIAALSVSANADKIHKQEPDLVRGRPRVDLNAWKGIGILKLETPAQRYRRQAAECEQKAKKANGADRTAWERLAEDWRKLARGAEANPRLNFLEAVEGDGRSREAG